MGETVTESRPAAGTDGSEVTDAARPAVIGALSPSRAGDFMTCPLLYRFRVIDQLPEPPSPAAARGTLVHAVLERLFDRPPAERTPSRARELVEPEWERLLAGEPGLAGMFADDAEHATWLADAHAMLDRYFALEDPRRLEPARREMYVETVLESGLLLRGYIDRLDVAPNGDVRIVDYKTGTAPRAEFEARALFQMKFYALVLWRLRGQVPRLLQLMYLGNGETLRYEPDERDLRATERKAEALWQAISRARENADWRPRPSRVCDWCAHKAFCPAWGGVPPPPPGTGGTPADPAATGREAAEAAPGGSVPPGSAQPGSVPTGSAPSAAGGSPAGAAVDPTLRTFAEDYTI